MIQEVSSKDGKAHICDGEGLEVSLFVGLNGDLVLSEGVDAGTVGVAHVMSSGFWIIYLASWIQGSAGPCVD